MSQVSKARETNAMQCNSQSGSRKYNQADLMVNSLTTFSLRPQSESK